MKQSTVQYTQFRPFEHRHMQMYMLFYESQGAIVDQTHNSSEWKQRKKLSKFQKWTVVYQYCTANPKKNL